MRLYGLLVSTGNGPGRPSLNVGLAQSAMPELPVARCQDDASGRHTHDIF
jgi:hypothetical protein